MKATLEFTLPEEASEHRDAMDGYKWRAACQETRYYIRTLLKHGHQFKTPDEALEAVKKLLVDETEGLLQD
jgi:hypothetical protein